MPKAFDICRKKGGKIRTLKLKNDKYMPICYLNGKSYRGEIKSKGNDKYEGKDKGSVADAIKDRN